MFWRELYSRGIDPFQHATGNEDIPYPRWTKEKYPGGSGEYSRLEKAMKIHTDAALASTSWGLFQILGTNFKLCGFDSVRDFVFAMYPSEREHLAAFCTFILNTHYGGEVIAEYLRRKDWRMFALAYNGPGYAANQYDTRLAEAYRKWVGAVSREEAA